MKCGLCVGREGDLTVWLLCTLDHTVVMFSSFNSHSSDVSGLQTLGGTMGMTSIRYISWDAKISRSQGNIMLLTQ